jgi:hypothetical protein
VQYSWFQEKHVMMPNRRSVLKRGGIALFGAGVLSQVETPAQAQRPAAKPEDCNCTHAPDGSPLDTGTSEIRPVIERYQVELRDVERVYALPGSAVRQAKLEGFYAEQLRLLDAIHFDALSQSGKVDYLLIAKPAGTRAEAACGRGEAGCGDRAADSVPANHHRFRGNAPPHGDGGRAEIRRSAGAAQRRYRRGEGGKRQGESGGAQPGRHPAGPTAQ